MESRLLVMDCLLDTWLDGGIDWFPSLFCELFVVVVVVVVVVVAVVVVVVVVLCCSSSCC